MKMKRESQHFASKGNYIYPFKKKIGGNYHVSFEYLKTDTNLESLFYIKVQGYL